MSTLTQVRQIVQRSYFAGPVDRSSDTKAAVMTATEEQIRQDLQMATQNPVFKTCGTHISVQVFLGCIKYGFIHITSKVLLRLEVIINGLCARKSGSLASGNSNDMKDV